MRVSRSCGCVQTVRSHLSIEKMVVQTCKVYTYSYVPSEALESMQKEIHTHRVLKASTTAESGLDELVTLPGTHIPPDLCSTCHSMFHRTEHLYRILYKIQYIAVVFRILLTLPPAVEIMPDGH